MTEKADIEKKQQNMDALENRFVNVGEIIIGEQGFLRGHGVRSEKVLLFFMAHEHTLRLRKIASITNTQNKTQNEKPTHKREI